MTKYTRRGRTQRPTPSALPGQRGMLGVPDVPGRLLAADAPAQNNPALEAALSYARRGWKVVRLHKVVDGQCTCKDPKCRRMGAHPLVEGDQGTTDENEIRRWWAK